jgi:hypothetical protein
LADRQAGFLNLFPVFYFQVHLQEVLAMLGDLYGALCEKRLKELETKIAQKGRLAKNDLYEWKRYKDRLEDSDAPPPRVGAPSHDDAAVEFAEQYLTLRNGNKTHKQTMTRLKDRLRKQGHSHRNTAAQKLERGLKKMIQQDEQDYVLRLETAYVLDHLKIMGKSSE